MRRLRRGGGGAGLLAARLARRAGGLVGRRGIVAVAALGRRFGLGLGLIVGRLAARRAIGLESLGLGRVVAVVGALGSGVEGPDPQFAEERTLPREFAGDVGGDPQGDGILGLVEAGLDLSELAAREADLNRREIVALERLPGRLEGLVPEGLGLAERLVGERPELRADDRVGLALDDQPQLDRLDVERVGVVDRRRQASIDERPRLDGVETLDRGGQDVERVHMLPDLFDRGDGGRGIDLAGSPAEHDEDRVLALHVGEDERVKWLRARGAGREVLAFGVKHHRLQEARGDSPLAVHDRLVVPILDDLAAAAPGELLLDHVLRSEL